MKVLVFVFCFVTAGYTENQPIISIHGKIIQKSWRTKISKTGDVMRDIQVQNFCFSQEERGCDTIWYRVPEKVAQQLSIGDLCLFDKKGKYSPICTNMKLRLFSPLSLKPHLEKLFISDKTQQ